MNCGWNAPFAVSWDQTHLHIHRRPHLHLGCPGCPRSHNQFGFLTAVTKAEMQKSGVTTAERDSLGRARMPLENRKEICF